MSTCSRCSVARLMNRYKPENVIQINRDPIMPDFGDGEFEIFVFQSNPAKASLDVGSKAIIWKGKTWSFAMTVFSNKHAYDDCDARGKWKKFNLSDGFPTVVDEGETVILM